MAQGAENGQIVELGEQGSGGAHQCAAASPAPNVIAVVDSIKELLPQIKAGLPASVDVTTLTDRTNTIRASVADVEFELVLAVMLVVLVIYVFLRNLPATFIPSLSVPLSIVGTFAAMYLLGYSLNNLSPDGADPFRRVFVVDDANRDDREHHPAIWKRARRRSMPR